MLPSLLGRLHEHYQTPIGALAALGVDFAAVLTIYTTFHVDLGALITWPSTVFLVLYGIAMMSALKLIREGWGQRIMPLIPLLVCAGLYALSGWAMGYPVILGTAGWVMHRIHGRTHASGKHLDGTSVESSGTSRT